ncbi:CISD1-like, partial [Ictidomys tridecemlineatus]|uniref:Iron sulphur domain-containing protein n=1 Tax=Ictidomys tridecemlineatus TaxID=43179 RepID=A0A287D3Y9_ICTTR
MDCCSDPVAGTTVIGYLAYKIVYAKDLHNKAMANLHSQKDNPKIVHAFDMEELGDNTVYCHCWRSNLWSGDNTGPLIVKKKKK